MLKVISLIVFIAVIVQRSSAGPEETSKILADCKISEKLTDVDVTNFKIIVKPVPKEVKCLQTCVVEKMGLISNNTINKEGFIKLAKALPNSNEKVQQSVSEIIDACKGGQQETDRCEFGGKFFDCVTEEAIRRSLNHIFINFN